MSLRPLRKKISRIDKLYYCKVQFIWFSVENEWKLLILYFLFSHFNHFIYNFFTAFSNEIINFPFFFLKGVKMRLY